LLSSASDTAVAATTFTVNSTGDPGSGVCDVAECTLREAIGASNSNVGKDTIAFAIPGAGPHTIQPASALPNITDAVILDATTQPGYVGVPLIVLDGVQAGTGHGLRFVAGSSEVAGFQIVAFSTGITLVSGGGNIVRSNYIGTDGSAALGGSFGITVVNSSDNLIGGASPQDRNVISAASQANVFIQQSNGNTLHGNYIGTDATGQAALGLDRGVFVFSSSDTSIGGSSPGEGNLISGGVVDVLVALGSNNKVIGNKIGTDVTGTALISTSAPRIELQAATASQIGGTLPGEGNLIAGGTSGVLLRTGSTATIQGNLIGTDVTGTLSLGIEHGVVGDPGSGPNTIGGPGLARNVIVGSQRGISLSGSGGVIQGNYIGTDITGTVSLVGLFGGGIGVGSGAIIGGPGPGEGNLISGGQFGIFMGGSIANARIEGNLIGTQADGVTPLGNTFYGISLASDFSAAFQDLLPNPTAVIRDNTIANNGREGIRIFGTARRVHIESNSIHSNGDLGIDLNFDGVTPNDLGDPDAGANDLQNYPGLTAVEDFEGAVRIEGTLDGAASADFELEFYASSTCDTSGFGEGERVLGSTSVTTSGGGMIGFSALLPSSVSVGEVVTATATDAKDSTSEFSACEDVSDDADADGVINAEDSCPDHPGPPENSGCPPPGPPAVGGITGLHPDATDPRSDHASGSGPAFVLAVALGSTGMIAFGGLVLLVRRRARPTP
jgi:titin